VELSNSEKDGLLSREGGRNTDDFELESSIDWLLTGDEPVVKGLNSLLHRLPEPAETLGLLRLGSDVEEVGLPLELVSSELELVTESVVRAEKEDEPALGRSDVVEAGDLSSSLCCCRGTGSGAKRILRFESFERASAVIGRARGWVIGGDGWRRGGLEGLRRMPL
jgi:hypothetical protein